MDVTEGFVMLSERSQTLNSASSMAHLSRRSRTRESAFREKNSEHGDLGEAWGLPRKGYKEIFWEKAVFCFVTQVCFPGGLVMKNLPAGDARDVGSIPGSGRSPGEGKGSPLQCSCLENPRDRGAWWAAVYGVTVYGVSQSWTPLKRLSSSSNNVSFLETCFSLTETFWLILLF